MNSQEHIPVETPDATMTELNVGLSVHGATTEPFTVTVAAPRRIENTTPSEYRLARKRDGTLVLQGAYMWQEGFNKYGHEWRDIPTVEL